MVPEATGNVLVQHTGDQRLVWCPFDFVLVVADHAGHLAEFMRCEADVLRQSHRVKPELGAGAMATNVDV